MSYDQLLEKLKTDLSSGRTPMPDWMALLFYAVMGLAILTLIYISFFVVRAQQFRTVERFGRYKKTALAGLHFKLPFIDMANPYWTLKIMEYVVKVETITSDKVTVVLEVPIQYNVIAGRECDAYYKLQKPSERIASVVFDVVRSEIPKLTLDAVFGSKDTIAITVQNELRADMLPFGFEINRVMITSVEPDAGVKAAMNEINAAQKQGEAELAKAHNEQLVQVAKAKGRLEAADLDRQAEIIDAQAVAQSVEIIGKTLHENEGYLRWKWIHMMENSDNATIYVPTEAGLPMLEAGKRTTPTA